MRTGRPEHLPGFNYVGLRRYFLTFCTDARRPHFRDRAAVDIACREILRSAETERFAVIVYCFMPDHLHLLVEGLTANADALRFIARAKQYSGYRFSRDTGGQLWQRYGFERILRNEDATHSVARYILENPVRARLVQTPEEYPFSGCPAYSIAAVLDAVAWKPARSG